MLSFGKRGLTEFLGKHFREFSEVSHYKGIGQQGLRGQPNKGRWAWTPRGSTVRFELMQAVQNRIFR